MNRDRTIRLWFLIAAGIVLAWLVMNNAAVEEAFTARLLASDNRVQQEQKKEKEAVIARLLSEQGPFTATIIASRSRVQPGGVVEFKFELIDSEGKAQSVPQLARSKGLTPRLALYDSQGQEIGTYSFRFG